MKQLKWIAAFTLIITLFACGYGFEGGGYVNKDIVRVAVRPFENKSSESGAGVVFANALIREIIEKTDTRVVDESGAQAVFNGRIEAIRFSTLSRESTETVVEREVQATVDISLVDKQGKVLWSLKDFSTREDYSVNADQITDESNKREAVQKIADRCAEKLVSKTILDF